MTITKDKAFCVTSVTREDVKYCFNKKYHEAIDKIPDDDMEGIADKLGDCLMGGGGYWMFIKEFGKEWFMEYYYLDEDDEQ